VREIVMRERQAARMRACTITSSEGEKPSISRALNQDVMSGEKSPGRRNRRSLGEDRGRIIRQPRIVQKSRRAKNKFRYHKREFKLFQIELGIAFFLGPFAFIDVPAKLAGVLAVKSFDQRFAERSVLGIADDHLCPGQRLNKRPMHADGGGERQHQQKPGQS
jgi:hypothetical protein